MEHKTAAMPQMEYFFDNADVRKAND